MREFNSWQALWRRTVVSGACGRRVWGCLGLAWCAGDLDGFERAKKSAPRALV